jgi:thiol-disulfide isomerase/thioredoxin
MPESARFAALFLSSLAASLSALLTLPLFGADLRTVKEPAKIASVFPAGARLRVVNVWATWCAPCVAEMPDLRTIDQTFGSEVALVGVSLDDMIPGAKAAQVAAFLDKQKIAFTNVYYTGNADDLGDYLDFSGEMPVTIVLDAKGKELWRHQGKIDREKAIAQLRELLRRIR